MENLLNAMRLLIDAINEDKLEIRSGIYYYETGVVYFSPNRERTTIEERREYVKALSELGAKFLEDKRASFSSEIWSYLLRKTVSNGK